MRERFDGDVSRLADLLGGMSHLAARQIRLATAALLDGDLGAAERVVAEDRALDADRDRCEEYAQRLLARAPVAEDDLRLVIAVVQCAERVERRGDLARHVAELARRMHPQPVVPDDVRESFVELGRLASDMAVQLTDLIERQDGGCFARMVEEDNRIDALHARLMVELTGRGWRHGVPSAVNLTLAGRFYERFADQAVSVARMLDFAATGERPF
jgi:phosphate transport system protein